MKFLEINDHFAVSVAEIAAIRKNPDKTTNIVMRNGAEFCVERSYESVIKQLSD